MALPTNNSLFDSLFSMYFVIIWSNHSVTFDTNLCISFSNMNISNTLEAYNQDNDVPIICFFLKNTIALLSRKLIRLKSKDHFLFLQTVLKSYMGVMNYV